MNDAPSRRTIISRAVIGAGGFIASLAPLRNAQAAKFPQTSPAVAYQPSPKDDRQCDGCALFQAPDSCKVVDGTISAGGWCKLWAKKNVDQ
jgi:hypothetical protein